MKTGTEIRASEGMSQQKLGKLYGVSQRLICDIRRGKLWVHI